jgi:hypothetical protein
MRQRLLLRLKRKLNRSQNLQMKSLRRRRKRKLGYSLSQALYSEPRHQAPSSIDLRTSSARKTESQETQSPTHSPANPCSPESLQASNLTASSNREVRRRKTTRRQLQRPSLSSWPSARIRTSSFSANRSRSSSSEPGRKEPACCPSRGATMSQTRSLCF